MAKRRKAVRRAPRRRSHRGLKLLALTVALAIGFTLGRYPLVLRRAAVEMLRRARHALPPEATAAANPADVREVGAVAPVVVHNLDAEIVGEVSAESLAGSLRVITDAPEGSTVRLHISSPGGDGFAMIFWLDAVDVIKAKHGVKLSCDSGALVASAAAIIFESCDVRTAAATTVWLFHGVSSMAAGKAGGVEDTAKLMRTLDWSVAARIGPRLGMTAQQYIDWTDRRDRFLSTEELAKMDKDLVTK